MSPAPLYPLYTQGQLHPQSESILRQIEQSNSAPMASLTPQQARDSFADPVWLGTPVAEVDMQEMALPGPAGDLPVCIYTPPGRQPFPMLVYFHGGGFVTGSLQDYHAFCTFLASGASCIVVSVGYRLAPEHKHPAAVDDAVAAMQWVAANAYTFQGDASRLAVAGDSAGANLAAVCAISARDQGFPALTFQALICPWLDSTEFNSKSYHYFGNGLWLSTASMTWYRDHYLQNPEQAHSWLVSPLLVEDLSDLPPALVITAEFDVLRDEGETFADRLQRAGTPVQCIRYDGMLHNFATLPGAFPRAYDAIAEICHALTRALQV